jgi:hypothetical protein
MKEALIIVHRSDTLPRHLEHAIVQATRVCGPERVIPMLPPHLAAEIEGAVPLADQPEGFTSFCASYRHRHTTQSQPFMLSAFERYFQVCQLLRERPLDRLVMIDSDVLWYRPLERFFELELDGRPHCRFAIVPAQKERLQMDAPPIGSGHCLFAAGFEPMEGLCAFLGRLFGDPDEIAAADDYWQTLQDVGGTGGICDTRYIRTLGASAGWLRTAENNLNASNGFAMRSGIKRFRLHRRIPQLRRLQDRARVEVSFLHFQGAAKRLMGAARVGGWAGVAAHLALERFTGRRFAR